MRLRPIFLDDRLCPAAVGQLDPAFGSLGIATPNAKLNLPNSSVPTVIGRQSDGKIIIGSTAFLDGGDTDFAIYRLNANGIIDTTFGTGGLTTVEFDLGGTNADRLAALTIDSNNRIVAVGSAQRTSINHDFAIIRLTANGALDTTFNTTGKQTVAIDITPSLDDFATCVAIDGLGRIVVGGNALATGGADTDFAVVRLTATGQLDTTFNSDGRAVVPFDLSLSTLADTATGVGIGPNNSIVLVGNVNNGGTNVDAAVVRLLENGNYDTTFNGTGKRVYAIDNVGSTKENSAVGVTVLSDGRIVFAGTVATTGTSGTSDYYAGRLKTDGSPDTTFGTNGFVAAGFNLGGGKADRAAAVAVDSLGRVLIAGTVQTSTTNFDVGITRLSTAGALDITFDQDGGMQVAFEQGSTNADTAHGLLLMPNGRILVSASATTATGARNAVARIKGSTGTPATLEVGGTGDGDATSFILDTSNKYFQEFSGNIFSNYFGPVRTAVGDFNGDGVADSVFGIGPGGGSLVRIVSGATGSDLVTTRATYEPGFNGGIFVAAGDIDGDGFAELAVSPDQGGGGRVQIFSVVNGGLTQRDNFFGIDDQNFRGGARVAFGDIDGDGFQELVVGAGFGGGPRIALFDGLTLLANAQSPPKIIGDFFAFPGQDAVNLRNGVFVAAGDLNGDGTDDLIFGGGPGGGPRVYGLSGAIVASGNVANAQANPVVNFFVANDTSSRGGVRLAVKDVDDDQRADLIVGSGEGLRSEVRVYLGSSISSLVNTESPGALWQTFDPFGFVPEGGVFVG